MEVGAQLPPAPLSFLLVLGAPPGSSWNPVSFPQPIFLPLALILEGSCGLWPSVLPQIRASAGSTAVFAAGTELPCQFSSVPPTVRPHHIALPLELLCPLGVLSCVCRKFWKGLEYCPALRVPGSCSSLWPESVLTLAVLPARAEALPGADIEDCGSAWLDLPSLPHVAGVALPGLGASPAAASRSLSCPLVFFPCIAGEHCCVTGTVSVSKYVSLPPAQQVNV